VERQGCGADDEKAVSMHITNFIYAQTIVYDLPCANFHETHIFLTALFSDIVHRILPTLDNKHRNCGYKFEANFNFCP